MKQLKKYFKIVKEIYDYFEYESGKHIYPIEDYTNFYWYVKDNRIFYNDSENSEEYIEDVFIEKYNGEEYVMFLIKDTHNLDDCLIIFDIKKQIYFEDE
jgi:hypothetical protein